MKGRFTAMFLILAGCSGGGGSGPTSRSSSPRAYFAHALIQRGSITPNTNLLVKPYRPRDLARKMKNILADDVAGSSDLLLEARHASRSRQTSPHDAYAPADIRCGSPGRPAGGPAVRLAEEQVAAGDAGRFSAALRSADRDLFGNKVLALDSPGGRSSKGAAASACMPVGSTASARARRRATS